MPQTEIVIRGAREHNLRNVDVTIPLHQLVVMTGVSGSGKSSLAFDTLYAEGQRRYIESLSSYARQFLGQLPKPDVDSINGLAPSISIQQKTSGRNPRSTVGTITEIYDYLRVLFARIGHGTCPRCSKPISAQSVDQIIDRLTAIAPGRRYLLLAPLVQQKKGEYRDLFADLVKQGFVRARVDGEVVSLSENLQLDRQMRHSIEVVIDRLKAGAVERNRLSEAVELAVRLGDGHLIAAIEPESDSQKKNGSRTGRGQEFSENRLFSTLYACADCGIGFDAPSPQLFSFNSPLGMCRDCNGLGMRHDFLVGKLVPNPKLSFNRGALELLGPLRKVGRWRRHIYNGVLSLLEKDHDAAEGSFAKLAWYELPDDVQQKFLYGTGNRNITFTWKQRSGVWKHGGTWDGYVNELLEGYRKTKNSMRRRQLEKYMDFAPCSSCSGSRLNEQAGSVRIASSSFPRKLQPNGGLSIAEICGLSIGEAGKFFEALDLTETESTIAEEVLKEIRGRLGFLLRCGLDYLALDRTAPTLSGGESQRIRLASQIGCGLVGVVYILDEPSIGLHPRDNEKLVESLQDLRDQGNTVIVVEHDEETMRAADHIVDFGPGPGIRGGEIVAEGSLKDLENEPRSLTGQFLTGQRKIESRPERRQPDGNNITVKGATHNNLKNVDVEFPTGLLTCVSGVSGSGKSSLVTDILWQVVNGELNGGKSRPGQHESVEGLGFVDKAIQIDQSPIGRTPRSNPATYVKVFDLIRTLFTQLPDSRKRGYKSGRFSFNVAGGRCESCEGYGAYKLEMDFLADVWMPCPVCNGRRFNRETLQVEFKGASVADILEMEIGEAVEHFENHPKVSRILQTLRDVGLDYLKLGQPSPTLSGGEAQRIKLARELGKRSTGKTLYLLDEPTTGLHFADIEKLLEVLHSLVDRGNTVIIVEHNTDVLKNADWVIDLGPEGGAGGGTILEAGPPEKIAANRKSYTGRALAPVLKPKRRRQKSSRAVSATRKTEPKRTRQQEKTIEVQGARQHNLQDVDVSIPRNRISVFSGPSGSGKSSLAMDTLFAEGQRRYVESLSAYARQFLGQMPKPRVEHIQGLSPAIAIEQKTIGSTPRSTVGTVTEIYDYLRVLYARLGHLHCPDCGIPVDSQTTDEVVDRICRMKAGTRIYICAPREVHVGQSYERLWDKLRGQGFQRVRVDGITYKLDDAPDVDRRRKHRVEIICDRVQIAKGASNRSRIADSVESAFELGEGLIQVVECLRDTDEASWPSTPFSLHHACQECGRSLEELTPHSFSFNSPLGWCPACDGLGTEQGTELAQVVPNAELTLNEGAISVWPNLDESPMFRAMLDEISRSQGIPLDVPFRGLSARHRRLLLHGCGDTEFSISSPPMQIQYKGVYPALDEASRVSYPYRLKLHGQIGEVPCSECQGSRLRDDAAAVVFQKRTLFEVCEMPLLEALDFLKSVKLTKVEKQVAGDLLNEAIGRLTFLVDVGLTYLTLGRTLPTLSGGEIQRIRLAGQLGRALTGVLYVLDEPTIGLHPRDNSRLLETLERLRDIGNTLVLVEHDREVINRADRLFDFGPRAGRLGGQVVANGTPKQVARRKTSLTGQFLSERRMIPIPDQRRFSRKEDKPPGGGWLELLGARQHNLRNVDLRIPLGTLTVITGVSGSGKSSLIESTLARAVAQKLHRATENPGPFDELRGLELINKQIVVDQQALGATPASNPATYTGVFDHIRELFTRLPESRVRGFRPGRFSFNRAGGRCDACEGLGQKRIEMHFLPDVWVECDVCRGHRYNQETLSVRYRGHTISDVLDMPIGKAFELFANIPKIRTCLGTLVAVGLDYLTLGQSAPTLSGGEAQRVKLAAELARPQTGQTLYVLDEPTTGLHFDDVDKLLSVLNSLVEMGNTVVVIEHNLDVIKSADWLIDVGPDAGVDGGWIVAEGTPEQLVSQYGKTTNGKKRQKNVAMRSWTAECLKEVLVSGDRSQREVFDAQALNDRQDGDVELSQVGRGTDMPWKADGPGWHTRDRISHNGQPARWEGSALQTVVDKIEEHSQFAHTNWNDRSIVEITGPVKKAGWFFHALTGDEWLLTLKFRVKKNTFNEVDLSEQLGLREVDDIDELAVYGRSRRVRVKNLKAPWQEVSVTVHWLSDIETEAFRTFMQKAIASFMAHPAQSNSKPEDVMPWKVLGRKWHLSRKGFPSGKRVAWTADTLDSLLTTIESALPDAEVEWGQRQIVSFTIPSQSKPLVSVHTKRRAGIDVTLTAPAGQITLGQVSDLGDSSEVKPKGAFDQAKIRFTTADSGDARTLVEIVRRMARR